MTDLLVFAPHPDDAEIGCGGTIHAQVRLGASVVVIDATRGELGSRGSPDERARESEAASRILGLSGRENLGLPDGHLRGEDLQARGLVIDAIRRHRPAAVLCIAGHARHPDHLALHQLVTPAIKAAALHRLASPSGAAAHGTARLWYYEAELPTPPSFLVPLSAADWAVKRAAIACYSSQLHQPGVSGPTTTIASEGFLDAIDARGRSWGFAAGSAYAEAFIAHEMPRIRDLRTI
jgi:bacillithiol biosynthesis deacetylase BshB1